jgi:hypothetical protein
LADAGVENVNAQVDELIATGVLRRSGSRLWVSNWNAGDLERKLTEFQTYYNTARSHASLAGHTPLTFPSGYPSAPADLNRVRWVSHCRGLVQLPVAGWREFETHRLGNEIIDDVGSEHHGGRLRRRQGLGGLLSYYYRAA